MIGTIETNGHKQGPQGRPRPCRFCQGKGCIACPPPLTYEEAFPNGPVPLATIQKDDPDAVRKLKEVMAGEGVSLGDELAGRLLGRLPPGYQMGGEPNGCPCGSTGGVENIFTGGRKCMACGQQF